MSSKWKKVLAIAAVTTLVASCGGGGGDEGAEPLPAPDAANKYVGTWVLGCTADGADSFNETITLTKTGARSLNLSFEGVGYVGSTDCSTPPQAPVTVTGTITLDSETTGSFEGNTVTFDRVTATFNDIGGPTTEKWTTSVLPTDKLFVDFDDGGTPSQTVYPTDPNDGSSQYTKAP